MAEASLRLGIQRPTVTALHIRTSGQDGEADLRAMCSGHLPQVGQRYVYVCTGVHVADTGQIDVSFLLTPLEEPST
jgi:hypothetical protein